MKNSIMVLIFFITNILYSQVEEKELVLFKEIKCTFPDQKYTNRVKGSLTLSTKDCIMVTSGQYPTFIGGIKKLINYDTIYTMDTSLINESKKTKYLLKNDSLYKVLFKDEYQKKQHFAYDMPKWYKKKGRGYLSKNGYVNINFDGDPHFVIYKIKIKYYKKGLYPFAIPNLKKKRKSIRVVKPVYTNLILEVLEVKILEYSEYINFIKSKSNFITN